MSIVLRSHTTFFHMKGDIEELLVGVPVSRRLYFDSDNRSLPVTRAARRGRCWMARPWRASGSYIPKIAAARKLRQDVYIAEILLDRLYKHSLREPKYERISKFPAVERDFSFVLDDAVTFEQVLSAVEALGIPEMQLFTPREIYRGEKVGTGKYSVLLHAEFQSKERTLRDDEVAQWSAQILQALEKLGGVLRG